MSRRFKNPSNGHVEEASSIAWLWAFLFGGFYFAVKGLWRHFIVQVVLIVLFLGTLGPAGMTLVLVMWIGYAFAANGIVAGSYLRNGWVEFKSGDVITERSQSAARSDAGSAAHSDERACPFCAEPIKKAAIKCKHCGSEVKPEVDAPVAKVESATPARNKPMGLCPNCSTLIEKDARECHACHADFSAGSNWKVKPI